MNFVAKFIFDDGTTLEQVNEFVEQVLSLLEQSNLTVGVQVSEEEYDDTNEVEDEDNG